MVTGPASSPETLLEMSMFKFQIRNIMGCKDPCSRARLSDADGSDVCSWRDPFFSFKLSFSVQNNRCHEGIFIHISLYFLYVIIIYHCPLSY